MLHYSDLNKNMLDSWAQWLMLVIIATWDAEIRRITI
jgi:hypothetical protein